MAKITASTQDHLDIVEIKNNCVVLKNGGACYVIETNAINFDLLSTIEQDAAISSYSALLNALSFPIQITIRSKRLDISDYIEKVKDQEVKAPNEKIKEQIRAYRYFIQEELVSKEDVLDKKFYVTVPYGTFSLSKTSPFGFIDQIFKPKQTKLNVDKILQDAISDLEPKKNFLIKEFARMGIKARQLTTPELIKLYYEIYNVESSLTQRIRGNALDYTVALVEPKI